MAMLTLRNVPDALVARLKEAAELDQRTPEEIQAELDHFAELRSHFKGPPLTSEEIIAAIGRDSHPRELEPMDPVDRPQP
jgi:hypothetical protein